MDHAGAVSASLGGFGPRCARSPVRRGNPLLFTRGAAVRSHLIQTTMKSQGVRSLAATMVLSISISSARAQMSDYVSRAEI